MLGLGYARARDSDHGATVIRSRPDRVKALMLNTKPEPALKLMENVVDLPSPAERAATERRAAETRLLEQVRDAGDREAFTVLFETFSPRLRAWVRSQGTAPDTADSIVQDVMVSAWTRAATFDAAKASARTWLYALARNRMIDHHRSNDRRTRLHDDLKAAPEPVSSAVDTAEADATRANVREFLSALPEEQRRIVLMLYVEGCSHREVAERLDLPIGTVKSRTRLAFSRMRKLMEGEAG